MNAAPLNRPQYGGIGAGGPSPHQRQQPLATNGLVHERDDRTGNPQGYGDSHTSPVSPSGGSDFISKYQGDTYIQQPQQHQQRNMAFANEQQQQQHQLQQQQQRQPQTQYSRSNNSLISQRSSASSVANARDSVVIEQYAALKKYLARHLSVEGFNSRPNKARDKLIRLSKQQFNELATDVYDELMRRQNTQTNQAFLSPKDSFHPKRNQARQKLATLPPGRFKELASDVLYEIERRFPFAADAVNSQYLTPEDALQRTGSTSSLSSPRSDQSFPPYTPRTDTFVPPSSRDRFPSISNSTNVINSPILEEPELEAVQRIGTQNMIIPNKSTMVEEDVPKEEDEYEDSVDVASSLQSPDPKGTPVQRSFLSNTIVPNKSTMVEESMDEYENVEEEEEEVEEENGRIPSMLAPSTIASTKSLSPPIFKSSTFAKANVNGMRNQSISPPPLLPKVRSPFEDNALKEREMQEKLEEYEDTIEALKERIAELQKDLKSTREELLVEKSKEPPPPPPLPPPPPPPPPPIDDRRLRELEDENEHLKDELREQQEVTNEVRREATGLLEEMKMLTSQQDEYFDNQTSSTREVARLQLEVREWKSRYSQLKIQSRSNTTSAGPGAHLNSPLRIEVKSRLVPTEDGVIEDASLSRFQNSIDELLAAARREDNEVLDVMTEVVKATRAIIDDLKRHGNNNLEDDPNVRKLTTRLSATANNLITATKNHVSSQGLSAVSLVDAAASHLTSTVVDLVKLVKLRPSSGSSFRSDEDVQSDRSRYSEVATPLTSPLSLPTKKPAPGPLQLGQRSNLAPRSPAIRDDVYALESPRSIDSRHSSPRVAYPSKDEEELRLYLDTQTQAIVESIQSLLARIRNPKLDKIDDFRPQIDEIISIVEKIVDFSDLQSSKIDRFGGDGGRILTVLGNLEDCCGSLRNVIRPIGPSSPSSEDGFKKRLARIAFDISKQIKELVRIVESEPSPNNANDLT